MNHVLHTAALCVAIRRMWALTWTLLVVMTGFRAAFLIQYAHPEVWEQFLPTVSLAFVLGVLHDLRVLLYILLPLTLSLLWMRDRDDAIWHKWLRRSRRYTFFSVSVILVTLGLDQMYYAHYQSHINVLGFAMFEDDFMSILRGAFENYPMVLYGFMVLAVLTVIGQVVGMIFRPEGFLGRKSQPSARTAEKLLNLHLVFHVVVLTTLSLSGTVPAMSRLENRLPESPLLRQLPENGLEELAKTFWTRFVEKPYSLATEFEYDQDLSAAVADFTGDEAPDAVMELGVLGHLPLQVPLPVSPAAPGGDPALQQPHVVLVLMESFATHMLRWQDDDSFDILGPLQQHWNDGIGFERFLPSDNGSAGSVLSLILDQPYRMGTKMLSQSDQQEKEFASASARQFAAQGYETTFIYGGPLEWRGLRDYLPRQGFQKTVGQHDLVAQLGLDPLVDAGKWGVWDEHLWTAVRAQLAEATEPQFIVVFSTSHHRPHALPADVDLPTLTPPAGLLERTGELSTMTGKQLKTFQYAAHAFGDFLDGLQADGLLDRTVLGMTGDHTAGMGIPFSHSEGLLVRGVPFLLVMPPAIRAAFDGADRLAPGSHKDIMPTLLHAAGLSSEGYRGLGSSLLDTGAEHVAFNAGGLLMHRQGAILLDQQGFTAFRWMGDGLGLQLTQPGPEDLDLRRRYQAAMAIADWLVYE